MRAAISRVCTGEPFRHEALLYLDADAYARASVRFIEAGLAADEPVLVAVPQSNIDLLRDHLGAAAGQVRFVDMRRAGRNPNRIIPWVLRAFLDEHPDRRVRIIGEPIWPGRAPEEVPLAIQHEALINRAFAGRLATILCPYDADQLDASILSFANRTHPVVSDGEQARPCASYTDPERVVATFNEPLPDRSAPAAELVFTRATLGELRHRVARFASRLGLADARAGDLQIAVNEVATNTVVHGSGAGRLRMWPEADRVVCEIQGPGHIADWLAGRLVPPEDSPRGRGLLVANLLCDLVETHTHPTSTTTRLHMRR
ncbi:MAG TPA: sensor histidine kinase [Pilimelia sp.]|nr:sensor histidine kinase [Pilimelia sp.]